MRKRLLAGIGLLALVLGLWTGGRLLHDHGHGGLFVSMEDGHFSLHDSLFFPLALNYTISLYTVGDSLWAGPYYEYNDTSHTIPISRERDLQNLRANLELVREMGFNTVRLVGMAEAKETPEGVALVALDGDYKETFYHLSTGERYERFKRSMRDVLDAVRAAGLRAIVLVIVQPDQSFSENFFIDVAERFQKDTVIMAYDLFNEPLYFDKPWREKHKVKHVVDRWRRLVRQHAPDQLFTIGLTGMRETFEWDTDILDADFLSFHPYEYEPEQVRNEIRWYSEHVRVPWIIGETSLPADNDSVPYAEQAEFARKTLDQSVACGAAGYSWWQYKDVDWKKFHADFMGVVNREGNTTTKKSGLVVRGTVKPLVQEFLRFDAKAPHGECACLPNYYNYSGHSAFRLKGRAVDGDGRPVANGVMMAWDAGWAASYHTPTKSDGTFELSSDFAPAHWVISSPSHIRIFGELTLDSLPAAVGGTRTKDLGTVALPLVEFTPEERR